MQILPKENLCHVNIRYFETQSFAYLQLLLVFVAQFDSLVCSCLDFVLLIPVICKTGNRKKL